MNWLSECLQQLPENQHSEAPIKSSTCDTACRRHRNACPFDGEFLVQVSGCRYAFDRSRPVGQRIVESDIDPQRTYSVACVEGLLSRGDMLHLAGRFGKIEYEERELTNITAAWRYIDKRNGIIDAQLDSRVRDVTDK